MAAGHRALQRQLVRNQVKHRPRVFLDRTNPLEVLTEEEVFARYRFRTQTILYLVDLCDDVRRRTNRSFAVPILLAVLTYLRFTATGAIQLMVGDTLALSQPTISRLCKQVGETISGLAGRFIQFPEGEEAAIVKQNFGNLAGKYYNKIIVIVSAF